VADQEFLDAFDLRFIAGDPDNALRQPFSVVLTEDAAARLFGDEDPMGKSNWRTCASRSALSRSAAWL
jgi:putative ABC transport system permease protein